jgi:hypothetical protein
MLLRSLAFAICVLGLARPAFACSCMAPNPVCHSFWNTGAVFVGEVESITDLPMVRTSPPAFFLNSRRVHLRVREQFSGAHTEEVDVFTGLGGGDCGYAFAVGTSYLVFANARSDKNLATGICDRTKPLAEAAGASPA